MILLIIILLLIAYYDPWIDKYKCGDKVHIILWYNYKGERTFIELYGG